MLNLIRKEWSMIGRLWPLLRLHPLALAVLVVLGVLASIAESTAFILFIPLFNELFGRPAGLPPNAVAALVQGLFDPVAADIRIYVICGAILLAFCAKAALTLGYGLGYLRLVTSVGHDMRSRLFRHMLDADYALIARNRAGSAANLMSREVSRASDAVGFLLYLAVLRLTTLVFGSVLLLISWKLVLLVAAAIGVHYLLMRRFFGRTRALARLQRKMNALQHNLIEQASAGMRTIRDFGREDYEYGRFADVSSRVARSAYDTGRMVRTTAPVYELLGIGLVITILMLGARSPAELSSYVVFIAVLHRLQPILRAILTTWLELAAAAPSVEEVTGVLRSARPRELAAPGRVPAAGIDETIGFDQVSFVHGAAETAALHEVSFTLPAGRTTALVGRSGSGKSTVVDLLLRHIEPSSGTISVGNEPLSGFDPSAWRARIALVRQDVFLFEASVHDNIAYGRPSADRAAVIAAARQAQAHGFAEALPRGYDTVIGRQGMQLSGGERQRLTLARALIRDPRLLILDEATSALDATSERLVREALIEAGRGRTVLIVAHRPNAVAHADHMVVLDRGRVIYEGAFDAAHLAQQPAVAAAEPEAEITSAR